MVINSSSLPSSYQSNSCWVLRGINYPRRRQVSSFNYYVKPYYNNYNYNYNSWGGLLSLNFNNPDRFYRLRVSGFYTRLHFVSKYKCFGPDFPYPNQLDGDPMGDFLAKFINFFFDDPDPISEDVCIMVASTVTVLLLAIMAAGLSPNSFPVELVPTPGPFSVMVIIFIIQMNIKKSMNSKEVHNWDRCGTLFFLQVAILDKNRNLQRELNNIAASVDTNTLIGLNYVLREMVKALLHHQDSCHFAYRYARYDNMEDISRPCFNILLKSELQRYDKNENKFVNDLRCKKESVGEVDRIDNEYSAVTLLVLAGGECWIPNWHTPNAKKVDVKTTLQLIGSIPENNLEDVKVLCTQQTENYGRLMRPVSVI